MHLIVQAIGSNDMTYGRGQVLWPTEANKTRGVSHCGLAIYIKKYIKAKEKVMKIQIFHHAKI
jgi:hypothetical protein